MSTSQTAPPSVTSTASRSGSHTLSRTITAPAPSTSCPAGLVPVLLLSPPTLRAADLASGAAVSINVTLDASMGGGARALGWSGAVGAFVTLGAASDGGSVGLTAAVMEQLGGGAFAAAPRGLTVSMRLGSAPGLRVPGPDNATLLVQFAEGSLDCSGGGAFAVAVAIAPYVEPRLAAAQAATLASGAVGVAAASVGVGALGDVQALVALSTIQCGSPSGQAVSQKAAFVLGPLQVGSGGAEGKLWGLLILVLGFGALQVACVGVVYAVKRRGNNKRAKPPRSQPQPPSSSNKPHTTVVATTFSAAPEPVSTAATEPGALESAMALCRFPGALYGAAAAAQQGMAVYALGSMLTGQVGVAALMGIAFVLAVPALVLYGARRWAAASFDVDSGSMIFYKYEYALASLGPPTSRRASLTRQVCGAMAPVGVWRPRHVVQRVGSPYRLYRPVWASMAVAPTLQALLIGAIVALPVSREDSGLCGLQFFGVGLVACMMALSAVVARPYTTAVLTWIQLASSLSLMLAVIGNVGLMRQQAAGAAPGGYLAVAQVASILQTAVVVVRCVISGVTKLCETLLWKHDGKRVAWIEGMEPHVAERLDRNGLEECLAVEMTSVVIRTEHRPAVRTTLKQVTKAAQASLGGVVQAAT